MGWVRAGRSGWGQGRVGWDWVGQGRVGQGGVGQGGVGRDGGEGVAVGGPENTD